MNAINKSVTVKGIKTKVTFEIKEVSRKVLIDNQELGNNPKKTGVSVHVEIINMFIINGESYEVKNDFTRYRMRVMKDRGYKELFSYKGFSVANSEKKMVEFILNNN